MLGAASTVAFSLLSVISPTGQAVAQQENPQCYSATLYGDADVNNFHINSDGTPLVKDFGSRLNTDYGNSDAYGVFNQDGRAGLDSIIRGGGKNNLKPDQKRTVIISVSKEMMKKPDGKMATNPSEIAAKIEALYKAAAENPETKRVVIVPPFPTANFQQRIWRPVITPQGPNYELGDRESWEEFLQRDETQAVVHAFALMAGVAPEPDPPGSNAPDGTPKERVRGAVAPQEFSQHPWIRSGANPQGPKLEFSYPASDTPQARRDAVLNPWRETCGDTKFEDAPQAQKPENKASSQAEQLARDAGNAATAVGSNRRSGGGGNGGGSGSDGDGGIGDTNINSNAGKAFNQDASKNAAQGTSPRAYALKAKTTSSSIQAVSQYTQAGRWASSVKIPVAPTNWASPNLTATIVGGTASLMFQISGMILSLLMFIVAFATGGDMITSVAQLVDAMVSMLSFAGGDKEISRAFNTFVSAIFIITLVLGIVRILNPSAEGTLGSKVRGLATQFAKITLTIAFFSFMAIQSRKNAISSDNAVMVMTQQIKGEEVQVKQDVDNPSSWNMFSAGWFVSIIYYYLDMLVDSGMNLGTAIAFSVPRKIMEKEGTSAIPTSCDRFVDGMHYVLVNTDAFSGKIEGTNVAGQLMMQLDQLIGTVHFKPFRYAVGGSTRSGGNTWCLEMERRSGTAPGDWTMIARAAGLYAPLIGAGNLVGDDPNRIATGKGSPIANNLATDTARSTGRGIHVNGDGTWIKPEDKGFPISRFIGETDSDSEIESRFYNAACEWGPASYRPVINPEWVGVDSMGTAEHDSSNKKSYEYWIDKGVIEGESKGAFDFFNQLGSRLNAAVERYGNGNSGLMNFLKDGVESLVGNKNKFLEQNNNDINVARRSTPKINASHCIGIPAQSDGWSEAMADKELNPVMPNYEVNEEGNVDHGFGADIYPALAWRYSITTESFTEILKDTVIDAFSKTPAGGIAVAMGKPAGQGENDSPDEKRKEETNPDIKFFFSENNGYNPARIYYRTIQGQDPQTALLIAILVLFGAILLFVIVGVLGIIAALVKFIISILLAVIIPIMMLLIMARLAIKGVS